MKLQKQNLEYREELKKLSLQLDGILEESKKANENLSKNENNQQVETLNKKIVMIEAEIKKLRSKSSQKNDRFTLENTVNELKEQIRVCVNSTREMKKRLDDLHKGDSRHSEGNPDKIYADLKIYRKKLKYSQDKYDSGLKQHLSNVEEIKKLEENVSRVQAVHVDILKFESNNNTKDYDIDSLKSEIVELENQKKTQEQLSKQEYEKYQLEVQSISEIIQNLKKNLKAKTHEVNSKDFEINDLKRKLRSTSAKRYSNSPDVGQYDEFLNQDIVKEDSKKMAQVKSESRIPHSFKKPPRPDSNSPAAQRIKQLKQDFKPNI